MGKLPARPSARRRSQPHSKRRALARLPRQTPARAEIGEALFRKIFKELKFYPRFFASGFLSVKSGQPRNPF
ncbi:MAG: hypothetical protein BHW65_09960 [Verrucomicrobia bacterium CAG:312_58_20]|nr:MAG: hypothetical protein BHW65_09960 [Verrucomicrobia bacterium CAG:312_58_20]